MPASASVCRGCAGTGVGHHVPARVRQQIELTHEGVRIVERVYSGVRQGQMQTCRVKIAPVTASDSTGVGRRLSFEGPLALVVAHIAKREGEGYDFHDEIRGRQNALMPAAEHACEWCSGTGKPQLSVQTLTALTRST